MLVPYLNHPVSFLEKFCVLPMHVYREHKFAVPSLTLHMAGSRERRPDTPGFAKAAQPIAQVKSCSTQGLSRSEDCSGKVTSSNSAGG
jgi:hypothetical protein